jgi:NADPH:quinone reductase-like Zn-dependent oxidoreductase
MNEPIVARSVRYESFGDASVLHVIEREVPAPGPGKVRVAVRAAGLNPADYKTRNGSYPEWAPTLPAGIGREISGVVEAVGDGVELPVGTEVFGNIATNGMAEYVITSESNMARKPAELDWITAGSLSLVGQTAYDAFASQDVTAADTVLVSAAAGGVGVVVAQLALRAGATVIGTASLANHEFLRGLGIIPVAYGDGLVDAVRALDTVTVAFDNNGPATVEAALELGVSPDRINTIATDPEPYGIRRVGRGPINTATLEELARLVVAGELVLPIDSVYPLDEVVAAFEHLETGHVRGKVVLNITAG